MSTGLRARRTPCAALSSPSLNQGHLRVFVALAVLAVMAGGVARAADSDEAEQVIVSATRTPTPAVEVASSVTIITAADIEARQERTISDVLKDVPGLNVVQTGGPGGVTSVFIRGTNSNHTKVLIDGIDVSDPSNSTGAFDFGQLLTPDIERVEVLRGPQSGLYGSDAIGGVINITTRSGSGPATLAAGLEGGSFETFNQAARLSGSQDAFHYSVNVTHFHAGATPVTPLDLLPLGEARNDDYDDNLTVSTRLGYDLTRGFDLGLVARYTTIDLRTTGDTFDPVTFASFPAPEQTEAKTDSYFARVFAHLTSFEGFLDQTVGFAYSHERTSTVVPEMPESLNTGERRKADWQGNVHLATGELLVLGAEYQRDQIKDPIYASDHIASGYAELQSQLGGHWFSAVNVRYDDHNRFGSKVTYRFAPTYLIGESGTKLKASVGSGFKAPTLSQLYQDFPAFFFFANPNLKPETSTGFDAGFEQGRAQDVVRFGVTYFHNNIHELISTATDPNTFETTYVNVGHAETYGLESFIAYQPLRSLTLRLDYSYTEAHDETTGQELLRRPKHRGTLLAQYQATSAWQLSIDVLAVGTWVDGSRDFSISRLDAPGYTTVNFATRYELNKHFAVFGRITNLLDRHYQNPVGFLQPGSGAYAGIRMTL